MIKCVGYYTEEVDFKKYDSMGMEAPEPELVEADCYLIEPSEDNPVQCIFQIEKDKVVVTYLNGFEALIKHDKAVIKQLI